jgi:glucosamine--fructose-6-phosphate aminotransferase (isomerizing)
LTIAIVNDTGSPLWAAAECQVPMRAGPERAVAATKSVVNAKLACLSLVAAFAGDAALGAACRQVPERLGAALELDWSAFGETLGPARAVFVAARGHGLGAAHEIALKIGECLGLPAFAYSAAELRHGPRGAIGADTPVLILRQDDETAAGTDALASELRQSGHRVLVAGGAASNLAWIADGHPAADPLVWLVPAYRAIEAAARLAGRDPDNPPHLTKVTRTL